MPSNACSTIYAAISVEAVEICMPFWLNMNQISDRSRSAECEKWISGMMTFHLYRQSSPLIEEFLTKACSLSVSVLRMQACREVMRETITRVVLNSKVLMSLNFIFIIINDQLKNPELVCQLLGDDILDNAKVSPYCHCTIVFVPLCLNLFSGVVMLFIITSLFSEYDVRTVAYHYV
ncbi:hypothetical protein AHF37_01715 [Paragonimus kellicotti]|nr:hypothetical protein AHF37_01715 [Paragonimus kellicotti]